MYIGLYKYTTMITKASDNLNTNPSYEMKNILLFPKTIWLPLYFESIPVVVRAPWFILVFFSKCLSVF